MSFDPTAVRGFGHVCAQHSPHSLDFSSSPPTRSLRRHRRPEGSGVRQRRQLMRSTPSPEMVSFEGERRPSAASP
jgi:hypothetical protein